MNTLKPELQATIDQRFLDIAQSLANSCQALERTHAMQLNAVGRGIPGVYVLSESDKHLYAGRGKDVATRLDLHRWGNSDQASFAFKLAREATGKLKPTYKKEGSRKDLMNDPHFVAAFKAAKQRISNMEVRVVLEEDAVRQALLEIYVAVVLQTPYNDFNTT